MAESAKENIMSGIKDKVVAITGASIPFADIAHHGP